MKTRTTRRIAAAFDHRLESLEGRMVLSAEAGAAPAPAAPSTSDHQVLVADEAFLSAGSDQSAPAANSTNDADMYDLGGAWGSKAAAAQTTSTNFDDGAVDQMGDRPRAINPADLTTNVLPTYGNPAEYAPIPAGWELAPEADAPATPSAITSTPAPIVNAPETPALAADQTPVVIATTNAAAADTSFVWIESSDSWLLTTKAKAAELVVIQNTFVS
jgi:hypothetical protein